VVLFSKEVELFEAAIEISVRVVLSIRREMDLGVCLEIRQVPNLKVRIRLSRKFSITLGNFSRFSCV
jgi:hypothetical protein